MWKGNWALYGNFIFQHLTLIHNSLRHNATVKKMISTFLMQGEKIKYSIHEYSYVDTLQNAYCFASKTLLDLLLNDYDLMRRMVSVKHYLLMDQVNDS